MGHVRADERGWRPYAVGAKARGLLDVPAAWTPPFTVVNGLDASGRPGDAESSDLACLVELAGRASLLVRSDAPTEHLQPGQGRSELAVPDVDAIIEAIRRRAATPEQALVVVQVAIEPAVLGVLSNERRISFTADEWMLEGELSLRGPELRRVRADASQRAGEHEGPLEATDPQQAYAALGLAAARMSEDGQRRRIEWLWDSRRVWVVQADAVPEPVTADATRMPDGDDRAPEEGELTGAVDFEGRKLERWRTFRRLRWPRPHITVVTGAEFGSAPRSEWEARLGGLGAAPFVLRTDVSTVAEADELLLPTSPAVSDATAAFAFMSDTAARMEESGLSGDSWAFLASPLVACEASAWVRAEPNASVSIDALWGYPDGLLHLPHDSFAVGANDAVAATVRFKPALLVPEVEGWVTHRVPAPFDWDRVLDDDEVRGLARRARQLASHLEAPVELMVLARVGRRRGAAALLPFHFTQLTGARRAPVRLPGAERVATPISVPRDLRALDPRRPPAALRVEPDPSALRDADFLRQVGAWAARHRVPILFAGSLLGHAFHLLGAAGAIVTQPVSEPSNEVDWRTVVVAHCGGLERVQAIERDEARHLAALTLASLAGGSRRPGDLTHAQRALDVFLDVRSAYDSSAPGFANLGWVGVAGPIRSSVGSGTVPLFMDDARTPARASQTALLPGTLRLALGSARPPKGHWSAGLPGGHVLEVNVTADHVAIEVRPRGG